jgi:hypothetical protein
MGDPLDPEGLCRTEEEQPPRGRVYPPGGGVDLGADAERDDVGRGSLGRGSTSIHTTGGRQPTSARLATAYRASA